MTAGISMGSASIRINPPINFGSTVLAGKPGAQPNDPISHFRDPPKSGGVTYDDKRSGLEIINSTLKPRGSGSNSRAQPGTSMDAEQRRTLDRVRSTINPKPKANTAYDRMLRNEAAAKWGAAINKSFAPRTVKLPGDRQVILRARNNGTLLIDFPDQFNLGSKRVSLNVPGVNAKSTPTQISQAVQKLCSNPRAVEYVYDRGGRPSANDGGLEAQREQSRVESNSLKNMSAADKLWYVLEVALKNAPEAVATELKALFTPENMAKMAVLGSMYFVPGAGQVAAVVTGVCVGQQAVDVGLKYMAAIYTGLNATSKEDLDNSGKAIAQATAQLGVGVGTTLVGAGIAKGLAKGIAKANPQSPTVNGRSFGSEQTRLPGGAQIKPKPSVKPTGGTLPNLGATLKAAQKTTDNLVTGGTLAGLAYLAAKFDRGEVAIAYADQLPGMKKSMTTIFNDASADNSVAGAQRQVVVYTTKPGSKEADGYFLANANASVAASKLFNIANITKDIQNRTFNPGGWIDAGKINFIAQNLAAKDQTGAGARATVGSIGSINTGIYFGIPELNTRYKASVNLMSINGTVRAMSIGPDGKKQDKTSQVELAKVLAQAYLNFYSAVPDKDDAGKRVGQKPNIGPMQIQINKQLGLPGGFGLQISTVQPSKKEWNAFGNATMTDGTKRKVYLESYPKGKASSTEAFSILLNGNKNTNLNLGDVVAVPFSNDGKVFGEMGSQISGFSDAVKRAMTDPYPVGSPGYKRQQTEKEAERNGLPQRKPITDGLLP